MALAREGVVLRSMSEGPGKIPVRAFWGKPEDVPDLAKLPVRGVDGQVVPAGSLAKVVVAVDRPIARVDRERVVEIRVEIDPDDGAAFLREAASNLRQVQLPVGMTLRWQDDED